MICPHCHKEIPDTEIARHLAARGGRSTSKAKQEAARRNAKLGGRPRRETAMYHLELSGSRTVHKTANSHKQLLAATARAQGQISVARDGREVFFGNREELEFAIEIAEEHGKQL